MATNTNPNSSSIDSIWLLTKSRCLQSRAARIHYRSNQTQNTLNLISEHINNTHTNTHSDTASATFALLRHVHMQRLLRSANTVAQTAIDAIQYYQLYKQYCTAKQLLQVLQIIQLQEQTQYSTLMPINRPEPISISPPISPIKSLPVPQPAIGIGTYQFNITSDTDSHSMPVNNNNNPIFDIDCDSSINSTNSNSNSPISASAAITVTETNTPNSDTETLITTNCGINIHSGDNSPISDYRDSISNSTDNNTDDLLLPGAIEEENNRINQYYHTKYNNNNNNNNNNSNRIIHPEPLSAAAAYQLNSPLTSKRTLKPMIIQLNSKIINNINTDTLVY